MSKHKIANRLQKIQPSPTLAIAAKAKSLIAEGKDILSLSVGEPDFDTPEHIKQAAIDAIQAGKTKYTAVDGTIELKKAIINKLHHDNSLTYEANQVIASTGAKQCLYNALMAILNPGDEVIIPTPYWVSYPSFALLAEATPVIVPTSINENFKLTAQLLEKEINKNTRMLILNSPSNPSGKAYSKDELAALGEVLKKHPNIIIITDDIYEHILWNGKFCNILNACPELYDRTLVINGVSKAYAMTGWRLGYTAGPSDIIAAMKKIQSQSTSNPCSITQAAAAAAISGKQECIGPMLSAFKERHDFVIDALNNIDGVKALPCDGTFYAFPDMSGVMKKLGLGSDVELAEHLLNTVGLATVPGSAFGSHGFLRLSYATDMKTLEDAMNRLAKACQC